MDENYKDKYEQLERDYVESLRNQIILLDEIDRLQEIISRKDS